VLLFNWLLKLADLFLNIPKPLQTAKWTGNRQNNQQFLGGLRARGEQKLFYYILFLVDN
tara:strand:- start:147 stop:323 length:177 start_codon:yes stop_codon:yes gene_type:complete